MTVQSTGKEKQKKLQTLENKGSQRYMLASLARLERAAFRLGGERSIQLSYRDVSNIYSIFGSSGTRTSCRLGGGPSILVRYGGMYRSPGWDRLYFIPFPRRCQGFTHCPAFSGSPVPMPQIMAKKRPLEPTPGVAKPTPTPYNRTPATMLR